MQRCEKKRDVASSPGCEEDEKPRRLGSCGSEALTVGRPRDLGDSQGRRAGSSLTRMRAWP